MRLHVAGEGPIQELRVFLAINSGTMTEDCRDCCPSLGDGALLALLFYVAPTNVLLPLRTRVIPPAAPLRYNTQAARMNAVFLLL